MKHFSYKPDLVADPSENTSVTECLIEMSKSECHQKDPSLRRPGATNSVLSWLIISPGFHNIPA